LRRTSTTPFAQSSQGDVSALPISTSDIPGAQQQSNSSFEQSVDSRLSKEKLLQIYRNQEEIGALSGDVSDLFANGWNPGHTNASNGRSWGKPTDGRDNHGPDVCWDSLGGVRPIGLEDMSEEEKTVRTL
jgi:PERQ amino acid-rich with GYF domain-containing protein